MVRNVQVTKSLVPVNVTIFWRNTTTWFFYTICGYNNYLYFVYKPKLSSWKQHCQPQWCHLANISTIKLLYDQCTLRTDHLRLPYLYTQVSRFNLREHLWFMQWTLFDWLRSQWLMAVCVCVCFTVRWRLMTLMTLMTLMIDDIDVKFVCDSGTLWLERRRHRVESHQHREHRDERWNSGSAAVDHRRHWRCDHGRTRRQKTTRQNTVRNSSPSPASPAIHPSIHP